MHLFMLNECDLTKNVFNTMLKWCTSYVILLKQGAKMNYNDAFVTLPWLKITKENDFQL